MHQQQKRKEHVYITGRSTEEHATRSRKQGQEAISPEKDGHNILKDIFTILKPRGLPGSISRSVWHVGCLATVFWQNHLVK